MTTNITLTPEEAVLFIEFQKRHAFIELLVSIGAFDIRNGSITIHFDQFGKIGTIKKEQNFKLST